MSITRESEETAQTPGVCANEGCGRPAENGLCDNCALERALFHREEREEFAASRTTEVRTG